MSIRCVFGHKWLETNWLSARVVVVIHRINKARARGERLTKEEAYGNMPARVCERCGKEE